MPEHTINLSDADAALLQQVQQQQGLPSPEAAAEWLIKRHLRRVGRTVTQRGRALPIGPRVPGAKFFGGGR